MGDLHFVCSNVNVVYILNCFIYADMICCDLQNVMNFINWRGMQQHTYVCILFPVEAHVLLDQNENVIFKMYVRERKKKKRGKKSESV